MKKSDYTFLIIIAMPMIAFIVSILLLGLVKQTLDTLGSAGSNNTIATPDLHQLPRQPVPTIHPKTEHATPSQAKPQAIQLPTIKTSMQTLIENLLSAKKAPGSFPPGAEQEQDLFTLVPSW